MHSAIVIEGPPLERADRVVLVIHGMSTTVETLRAGYPAAPDGRLTKLYWHLPILRDGADLVRERRADDLFASLFGPVVDESRTELKDILAELTGPVGLFGFSIGGLIALLGAADNAQVRAVVTMGGVPSLDYLRHYYPDYGWDRVPIQQQLASYNVLNQTEGLVDTPILLCHGDQDDVAHWEWMQPLADRLANVSPMSRSERFPHLHHRLKGQTPAEDADLSRLRMMSDGWFLSHLPSYHPNPSL